MLLRRSSSWCDMNYEVLQPPPETTVAVDCCIEPQRMNDSVIFALPAPPNNEAEFLRRCDKFKAVYAEILYRWQLLVKRSELLKCTSQTPTPHRGLELTPVCVTCEPSGTSNTVSTKEKASLSCTKCKKAKLTCVICRLRVKGEFKFRPWYFAGYRYKCTKIVLGLFIKIPHNFHSGLSTFCPACAHGGHSNHMVSWFKTHDVCPTGCGCRCLQLFNEKSSSRSLSAMNSKNSSAGSLKREEDSESLLSVNLPWVNWN